MYQAVVDAIDAIGDGAVITHGSLVVYANSSFCAIAGMEEPELVGKPWPMELLPPEAREHARKEREHFDADPRRQKRYRARLLRRGGGSVDVEASVTTVDTGQGVFRVTLFRDISREVALDRQYRALLNAGTTAREGMGAIDDAGLIVSWNEGAEEMFGVPRTQALGTRFSELLGNENQARTDAVFESLLMQRRHAQIELTIRREGTPLPVTISAVPTSEAGSTPTGVAFIVASGHPRPSDNESPEDRLRHRASHELRTPLAISLGFLETLDQRWTSLEASQQRHFLRLATASIARLFGTVERLLAGTGIELRTPETNVVDLGDLILREGIAVHGLSLDDRVLLRDDTCRGVTGLLAVINVTSVQLARSGHGSIMLTASPSSPPPLMDLLQPVVESILQPVDGAVAEWSSESVVLEFP